MEPLCWPLEQVETTKEISTLSTKKRARVLLGIEDAMQAELWRQRVYQEHRDNHARRQAELADMERCLQAKREHEAKLAASLDLISTTLSNSLSKKLVEYTKDDCICF